MSAAQADDRGSNPFSVKAVLFMVLVGVFSFAAFTVLSTYAPDLKSGRDGRGHALSRSAIGFAGLVKLAKDAGLPVRITRNPAIVTQPGGLRVLIVEQGMTDQDLATAVSATGKTQRVLVVAPKWTAIPDPFHPGWVRRAPGLVQRQALNALPAADLVHLDWTNRDLVLRGGGGLWPQTFPVGTIESLGAIKGGGWMPILSDDHGHMVLAEWRDRPGLFVLADPDLMNNQGLASLDRARLAIAVLDDLRGGGPVVFDVTLNGFERSRSVLKLAFEPPFLAATLCAVAAAILMGLHAAARFGAPRAQARALALGKTPLADNSAALLRLAKREPAMGAPYADLTRQAVARAVAAPRSLDRAELDAMLDRLAAKAGQPEAPSALFAQAGRVTDVAGLIAVARKLYDFRRGMTRERN